MPNNNPALEDEFAASIGRLALSWATLEVALDVCTHAVFHKYGGSTLVKELPRALGQKIRFLKDSFRKLPPLAPECDAAIRLLEAVKAASDFRHDMIHGIAVGRIEDDPSKVAMMRMLREATSLETRRFSASAEEVNQEAVKANKLSLGAWILADALRSNT